MSTKCNFKGKPFTPHPFHKQSDRILPPPRNVHEKCYKEYTRNLSTEKRRKIDGDVSTSESKECTVNYAVGKPDVLYEFVENHVIEGGQCV